MELSGRGNSRSLSEVFEYQGNGVRVVGTPDEPLFVATDVCRALGIGDTSKALERLDSDEKGTSSIRTPSGTLISTEAASDGRPDGHVATASRRLNTGRRRAVAVARETHPV